MSMLRILLGVSFLLLASLVLADELKQLNNAKDVSPCCIAQQLMAPCADNISTDCQFQMQKSDLPFGTQCTCNIVVFNLWSACMDIRNQSCPFFNDWADSCRQNQNNVNYEDYPSHENTKGIDIPTWAYIGLAADSSFDLAAALDKTRGWTIPQILTPIGVAVALLVVFGMVFFWYRRRVHRRYSGVDRSDSLLNDDLNGSRKLLGTGSMAKQVRTSDHYSKSWAIDDFESAMGRNSPESYDGHVWLTPTPTSPSAPISHRFRQYLKPSGGFWRNPFKARPVRVVSQQPRQGFRVDDADIATQYAGSRRPTLDTEMDAVHHFSSRRSESWSLVRADEIFDSRDDALNENSVLLISRAPGVDFSVASHSSHHNSPTTDVNVIPPSRQHTIESLPSPETSPQDTISSRPSLTPSNAQKLGRSRNPSMESMIRPAKTDPTMLFPASVRGAGYTGVPPPYSTHSRSESALSSTSTATPMTPPSMR